jgi:hypothetical protein
MIPETGGQHIYFVSGDQGAKYALALGLSMIEGCGCWHGD